MQAVVTVGWARQVRVVKAALLALPAAAPCTTSLAGLMHEQPSTGTT